MISSQQIGERIAQERKRRGLTQAEIAERLGVSRQTFISVEKGERRADAEALVSIARILEISLHDLLKEHRVGGEVAARFRMALSRFPAEKELRRAVDLLEKLGRSYVELERLNGITRTRAPLESLETYRDSGQGGMSPRLAGEDAARTVRGAMGLGDGPLVDLEDRLEIEAGLRVFHIDLPPSVAGILVWGDEIGACVAVNRLHPPERRLWSVAHECGHFLRDREAGDILPTAGPERQDASEVFAEAFAKELLLPAGGVRRRFGEIVRSNGSRLTVADLLALGRTFGVSFQAICLRLEELGLVPGGIYDRLKRQRFQLRETALAVYGRPSPGQERAILPERYVRLALAAFEEAQISEGSLADYLFTDRVTARGIYLDRRRFPTGEGGGQVEADVDVGLDVLRFAG